jgi:hypothetical protein
MSRQKIRSNLHDRLCTRCVKEGTFFGYFLCASKESNSPALRAKAFDLTHTRGIAAITAAPDPASVDPTTILFSASAVRE